LRSLPPGTSFEQRLEELQAEGERDPVRQSQLAAVRFYLRMMLWFCEQRWISASQGVTNYHSLIDQLRRSRRPNEPVLLVTFNYDRLIEQALTVFGVGIEITGFPQYIDSNIFKLYKLHGSVHWARTIDNNLSSIGRNDQLEIRREIIRMMPELKISERFRFIDSYETTGVDGVALFPAIALPVEVKSRFECPEDHIASLCAHLPKVTKILVIGWRGAEKHFLALLKEHLPKGGVPMQVVAGGSGAANATIDQLGRNGVATMPIALPGGFSEYIASGEAGRFFAD